MEWNIGRGLIYKNVLNHKTGSYQKERHIMA